MGKANEPQDEPLFETGVENGLLGWQAWFRIGVQTFYLQPVSFDKGSELDTKERAEWYEKNVQYAIGVLKDAIPLSSEWVRVEDNMPADGVEVLVWSANSVSIPVQGYYSVKHGGWKASFEMRQCMNDSFHGDAKFYFTPTHWQPLPEPPKQ
jgi:hypothetical protein